MPSSEGLEVHDLGARYDGRPVLEGISFRVGAAERVALLGPNGSGKTTLLRVLAGLEPAAGGSVTLDGRPLDGVPTHRRGIGFLFQEPSLFPGRSVAQNVAYGLEVARWPPREIRSRVEELAERLRFAALLPRPSDAVSGGERQRIALARTLAPRPRLVLLDEPFAAVDPELRVRLRDEFAEALRDEGVATVHVTHDAEEGMVLGDRLLLLREGRLVQEGRPGELFRHPVDETAARFLGYQFHGAGAERFGFHVRALQEVPEGPATFEGTVASVRPVPGELRVLVQLGDGTTLEWRPPAVRPAPVPGEPIRLRPAWSCPFPEAPSDPAPSAAPPPQR